MGRRGDGKAESAVQETENHPWLYSHACAYLYLYVHPPLLPRPSKGTLARSRSLLEFSHSLFTICICISTPSIPLSQLCVHVSCKRCKFLLSRRLPALTNPSPIQAHIHTFILHTVPGAITAAPERRKVHAEEVPHRKADMTCTHTLAQQRPFSISSHPLPFLPSPLLTDPPNFQILSFNSTRKPMIRRQKIQVSSSLASDESLFASTSISVLPRSAPRRKPITELLPCHASPARWPWTLFKSAFANCNPTVWILCE
jgi:hypothetical protein